MIHRDTRREVWAIGRKVRLKINDVYCWFDGVITSSIPLRVRITSPDPVWQGAEVIPSRVKVYERKRLPPTTKESGATAGETAF